LYLPHLADLCDKQNSIVHAEDRQAASGLIVIGGDGNDQLHGTGRDDELRGVAGNDYIVGFLGHDRLMGGPGMDEMHRGANDDILRGGYGDDILIGDDGADTFYCGPGREILSCISTSIKATQKLVTAKVFSHNNSNTNIIQKP
jgi:hypothetical protein